MKNSNKVLYSIYLLSLIANVLLIYFLYQQISGVKLLKESWFSTSYQQVSNTTYLLEVEGNLGYVGFIHHFKNYVIRRTDPYYKKAIASYNKTKESLRQLKVLAKENELASIQALEDTLDEYYDKILIIKNLDADIGVSELDQLVKVNDLDAEQAKKALREGIIPYLLQTQSDAEQEVKHFYQSTLYASIWLFPILIISTLFTARTLRKFIIISDELNTIFEGSPDGIIYTDGNGNIIKVNDTACTIFGYNKQEFMELKIENLVAVSLRDMHNKVRSEFMLQEQSREMGDRDTNIQGVTKDGKFIDLRITISARRVNEEMRSVCIVRDITQQKQLSEISETDQLTSIKNRRYFDEVLEKELIRSQRENITLTLIIIDLDHF